MSDTTSPGAVIRAASSVIYQWLQIVRLADTESVRIVNEAHGRSATSRGAQRAMHALCDGGVATMQRRPNGTSVIVLSGAMASPRSFGHDLIVARVSAWALHSGWLWERDVVARGEHAADGILTDPSTGNRVGVEIELSRKTLSRTRQILTTHADPTQVGDRYHGGVLYIGTTDAMRHITNVARLTGTTTALRGAVPAVAQWTHTVDDNAVRSALQRRPDTTPPGTPPPPPRPAAAPRPRDATQAAPPMRAYTDQQITDPSVAVDPATVTAADRAAAAGLLGQRLSRAEVTGDDRTATRIRHRLQEFGCA